MLGCGDPHRKKAWLTWSKENSWEDFAPVWRKFSLSHVSRALYGAWVLPLTFLMYFRLSVALCKLMSTCPTWFYVGQIWGWSENWFLSRPVERYSVHAKLWLEPTRLYFVDAELDFFFLTAWVWILWFVLFQFSHLGKERKTGEQCLCFSPSSLTLSLGGSLSQDIRIRQVPQN